MKNKFGLVLASVSLILFASFVVSALNGAQYGMMDANGQFYQYGMMGNNNQFYPTSSGYGGMMSGGYGMMGMMQMMTGYGGYGSGAILLSWIMYLLIIALIGSGIYWLIKSANRKR